MSGADKSSLTWDHYAANLSDLSQRQRERLIDFIDMDMYRFGVDPVMAKQALVVRRYEEAMRGSEGKYLNEDAQGVALSSQDQEHLFALHMLKALSKSLDAHTAVFNDTEAEDMKYAPGKRF